MYKWNISLKSYKSTQYGGVSEWVGDMELDSQHQYLIKKLNDFIAIFCTVFHN